MAGEERHGTLGGYEDCYSGDGLGGLVSASPERNSLRRKKTWESAGRSRQTLSIQYVFVFYDDTIENLGSG